MATSRLLGGSAVSASRGSATRESIMRVQSLRPELEFEVIKLILLRESYIQRLQKLLISTKGKVDLSVVGLVDVLRDVSLECIETVREWERSQLDYPNLIKPFIWNGVEYLVKMADDYGFLHAFPTVTNWLGFIPAYNPFFIPPEAFEDGLTLADDAFIVFGVRPPPPAEEVKKIAKAKFVKSPYNTPILNDLNIFPELSALNRIKKELKSEADTAAKSTVKVGTKDQSGMSDPYESFVGADTIKRAKACWLLLNQSTYRTNTTTSLANSIASSSLTMSKAISGTQLHQQQLALTGYPMDSIREEKGSPNAQLGSRLEEGSFDFGSGGAMGVQPLRSIKETEDAFIHGPDDGSLLGLPVPPRGAGIAATATISVAGQGVGDLEGSISRISATSAFSKTREEFSATSLGFHASLADTAVFEEPLPNKAMRLTSISIVSGTGSYLGSSVHSASSSVKSSVKTWTPHEVKLQKTVQRRGGELFVLTAAGTRGRIKAPWRKTRFQRMESDLEKIQMQDSMVSMALEESASKIAEIAAEVNAKTLAIQPAGSKSEQFSDLQVDVDQLDSQTREIFKEKDGKFKALKEMQKGIALNRQLLEYQLNLFRKIVEGGNVVDLKSQRERHKLGEGEALEGDNLISMSIEDNAAAMITRTMKKAFGRAIRRMLILKMNEAALKIQGMVRRVRMQGSAFIRNAKLTVARKLQKLHRGAGAREFTLKLKREKAIRWASASIQRIARGFLARQKTRRKRMFIRAVISAGQCVTLDDVSPADVDGLADGIEMFMRDFLYNMPMAVMTVLRGILYMFKGDEEESVIIEQQGFADVRRFQAKDVTWYMLKQFLRRKGRFLRRLRALVNYISFPGPCALTFSKTCQIHMDEVRAHVQESDFDGMEDGPKRTCINLLNYIKHMKTAFDFQAEFPEWFIPATPNWYRLCLQKQYKFRRAESDYNILLAAKERIDQVREEYKLSGRRWGHVYTAEVKIQEELKESLKILEKETDAYTRYIKKFESDERHDILLVEGMVKARILGLEVAQRDFKDYVLRNGEDDEKVMAAMRLQVDKKALSLLDIRVKLIKMLEMKEINIKARDFPKLMRLKLNKKMCKNSGNLLGRMMVLEEVWKDFVHKLGGYQYIPDLEGKKKNIFVALRREIQQLISNRRLLNVKIDKGLREQIDRCRDISHAARVERTKLYWDNPTNIEVDAELQEDIESAKRDADFEARQLRQAKLVKVPLGVRKPVMLVVDIRTPRGFREELVRKLEKIRFKVVDEYIFNPNIALLAQRLLDEGYNLIVFVDRGIHATSRAAFLGYFNAFIHSLVPLPRIVALDATLQLRFENWFSEFAPDIEQIFSFNEHDSASCGLMLGRLRRTALMFKWCLLNENDEEDKMDSAAVHIPNSLRLLFRKDLDDFMDEISGDRDGDDAMSAMSSMEKSGMILIATISSIMGIWKAPLLMWKEKQIQDGCNAFCENVQDAPKLCEMLWLNPLPNCEVVNMKRLEQARTLVPVWRRISQLNFYRNPARYLLARWCLETMDIMDQLALNGGGVDEKFKFLPVSHVSHLRWVDDVCDPDTRAEQMAGELLEASLSESLIYDTKCEVCEYEKIDNLMDTTQQYFRSDMHERRCRVFYSGTDCFVMVSVETKTRDTRRGRRGMRTEVRNFVSHMNILDMITMLQPNFTELYEGRQQKFIVSGPKKTHDWWELIARWGRLEKMGKKQNLSLLRSRFLMSSSIGFLNGYMCRFEIFEERFSEVLILIHGLPGVGTISYRGTKAEIKRLLEHCDEDEEKTKLEIMDAQAVASIFSDRLTAKPSFNQTWFLESGELQPKSLAKKVQVFLRLAGGPGRYVGRRLIKKAPSVILLVTIFELSNPSDIYGLRVVVHEVKHQQTAEFRISPLERSSLFGDDSKLIDQIVDRLRIVYTDLRDSMRCLIPLEQTFRPVIDQAEIYVEGKLEYDMFSGSELLEMRRRGEEEELEEGSLGQGSDANSQVTPVLFKIEESVSQQTKLESLEKWGWGLYFNRLFVEESRGNLLVSGGMELQRRGFSFTVLDKRTLRESYRFVPFSDAIRFLKGKTDEVAFLEELKNVEQATVYDLVDELFTSINVSPVLEIEGYDISSYEVQRLALSKPAISGDEGEDKHQTLTYVRLREVEEDLTGERATLAASKFRIRKAAIYCLAARNLEAIGGLITARNPYAIIKWNKREASRTTPSRNDLNPEWDDAPALASSTKDKKLESCVLDIDVWDWNTTGNRNGDFLGCITLTGQKLVSFLESQELLTLPLERSRRLTDLENKNVGGSLVLFGLLDESIGNVEIPQDYRDDQEAVERARLEAERLEQERLEAEKRAKSGGLFGMFSRKKAASVKPAAPVEEKKRVTISSEVILSPRSVPPGTKFSERHKVAEPEQYGPLPGEMTPLSPRLQIEETAAGHTSAFEAGVLSDEAEDAPAAVPQLELDQEVTELEEHVQEVQVDVLQQDEFDGDRSVVLSPRGDDDLSLSQSVTTGTHTFAHSQNQANDLFSLADRTVTDDSMTLAGITESRRVTVKLLTAEGLPLALIGSVVHCVVRFNGFFAAKVDGIVRASADEDAIEVKEKSTAACPSSPSQGGWVEPPYQPLPPSPTRLRREDAAGVIAFKGPSALVELFVPPFFELASCAVEIEFWSPGEPGKAAGRYLGRADIRGSRLVSFIESRGYESKWLTLYGNDGLPASSINAFNDEIPLRIQVLGDSPPPQAPKLTKIDLTIKSLRGLPFLATAAPDTVKNDDASEAGSERGSKKSDDVGAGSKIPTSLYVEVRFNDLLIGSTPQQPDSFNPFPLWSTTGARGNVFELVIPQDMTIEQCKLELRVFSVVVPEAKKGKKKKKGKTTFHGSKMFDGQAMLSFLETSVPPAASTALLDSPAESALSQEGDSFAAEDRSSSFHPLHPCAVFEESEGSKMVFASEQEMASTTLELFGALGFVEEEDWEMKNDGLRLESPRLPGDETFTLANPDLMLERIGGFGGFTVPLPNTTMTGTVLDPSRPWSRLSHASRGRADIPEGQRTNAMSDVQDQPELRVTVRLQQIKLEPSAVPMGRAWPKALTGKIYFNERLVGERSISVAEREKTEEEKMQEAAEAEAEAERAKSKGGLTRGLSMRMPPAAAESAKSGSSSTGGSTADPDADADAEAEAEAEGEGVGKGKYGEENVGEDRPPVGDASVSSSIFSPAEVNPVVLFIPRGQRLEACRLDVDLFHKTRLVGRITMEKDALLELAGLGPSGLGGAGGGGGAAAAAAAADVGAAAGAEGKSGTVMQPEVKHEAEDKQDASAIIEAKAVLPEFSVSLASASLTAGPSLPATGATGPIEAPIKTNSGRGSSQTQGLLRLDGSMEAVHSALAAADSGGALVLQLGTALHRRGQPETMRCVEVKLLGAQGLKGGLQSMISPRTGYGGGGGAPAALPLGSAIPPEKAAATSAAAADAAGAAAGEAWAQGRGLAAMAAGAPNETVYAVVKWNGQEIRRSQCVKFGDQVVFNQEPPSESSGSANTFTMFVPRGHRLRGCYLELVLWDGAVCLGSTLLHGEDLVSFVEGYGSAKADADFNAPYDGDDDTTVLHRSFPLQYSTSVPQALQQPVNGRLVLRGRVDPDPDPLATVQVRPRGAPTTAYGKIRTALPPDVVGWALHMDVLGALGSGGSWVAGGGFSTTDVAAPATLANRSLVMGSSLDQGSAIDAFPPPAFSMLGSSFVASLDRRSDLFRTKFRLEMPAVNFRKRQGKNAAEDRVCWRGRAMPAEVKGLSEDQKKSMFKNRSSRLNRRGRVGDLRVMADTAYLQEVSGEADAQAAALPVMVKEVVSDGPGLAQRVYRIEITTNSGASLGFADIANDEEIIRAVGKDGLDVFGSEGRQGWPLPDIFAYIVNKRTTLDFAPPKRRGKEAGKGMGLGMLTFKKEVAAPPVSVINIIREVDVSPTVMRFALHGGELGGMTLAEMEQKRRDEINWARDEAKRVAFNAELQRRKARALEEEAKAAQEDLAARPAFHGGLAKTKGGAAHIDSKTVAEVNAEEAVAKVQEAAAKVAKAKAKAEKKAAKKAAKEKAALEEKAAEKKVAEEKAKAQSKKGAAAAAPVSAPAPFIGPLQPKEQWIRLHNAVHNVSGIRFRTVVLFRARCPYLCDDPDRFFSQEPLESQDNVLRLGLVSIRSKDAFTSKVYELEFTGQELAAWIGKKFQYDLRKKFRRALFGDFLVSKMVMRFGSQGEYVMDIMSEDMGSAKSAEAVKLKLEKVRAEMERKNKEYEDKMAAALAEEMEKERLSRVAVETESESEEEEEKQSRFNFGAAGDAAARAAKEARDAMIRAASDAKAALGKMFTWGKKKE